MQTTPLIIIADTTDDLQRLAQSELSNLITYFHNNNLVPNPTKTNYTTFYPTPPPPNFSLNINNTTLQQNTEAPLLGVIVQHQIHKHTHTVTNIIRKLQPIIQKLKYAKQFLTTNIMKQLYYTHAYPHFIGSIAIWGTNDPKKEYIQPLIRTQKKIIRMIKNKPPRTHTKPLLNELELLTIPNLYIYRVSKEVHQYIHPTKPKNRPEHNHNYQPVSQIHQHNTRLAASNHQFIANPNQYKQHAEPAHTTEYLNQRYTAIWNALPQRVRDTAAPTIFATKLKEHLLEQQKL